jgi:hypothetical protein
MSSSASLPALRKAAAVVGKHTMTLKEFQKMIMSKYAFDKYWNYGISIAVIFLSLTLLYFMLTQPDKFKGAIFTGYLAFIFLLLLGLFGLNKIPNRYRIISIANTRPLIDKINAIGDIVESYGSTRKMLIENTISFHYQKHFWNSAYDIHLYFDETQVCLCILGRSNGSGFIDLGATEKLRQNIKDEIVLRLS